MKTISEKEFLERGTKVWDIMLGMTMIEKMGFLESIKATINELKFEKTRK